MINYDKQCLHKGSHNFIFFQHNDIQRYHFELKSRNQIKSSHLYEFKISFVWPFSKI